MRYRSVSKLAVPTVVLCLACARADVGATTSSGAEEGLASIDGSASSSEATGDSSSGGTGGQGTGEGSASASGTGNEGTTSNGDTASADASTNGVSASDSGDTSGTSDTSAGPGTTTGGSTDVGGCGSCPDNYLCKYGECIPDLGSCTSNDECPGDAYCDGDGQCIPYGVPPDRQNDPECKKAAVPVGITPVVQCQWTDAPVGDPTRGYRRVYTTPIVADLNLDQDPSKIQPSIVLTTWRDVNERTGILRVFDGRTCTEQMRIGDSDEDVYDDRPGYASQWVVGDLDGDVGSGGHPEIVGLHRTSNDELSAIAFAIDSTGMAPMLQRRWLGRDCADGDALIEFGDHRGHLGPSLLDLDDDGTPEVIVDTMVFDADGCLLNTFDDETQYLSDKGVQSAVADVDLDGVPELIRHDRVAQWDTSTQEWVTDGYFVANPSGHRHGYVAIVDAGLYSTGIAGVADDDLPEVVVVSASTQNANANDSGSIRLQTIAGDIVWGPVALHKTSGDAGRGGPPTASDFDGDGQPEFASAGATFYAVYDPDCDAGGVPSERPNGQCNRDPSMAGLPDGILWAQASKDASSNITGSSVFDFDGDGTAEAVYSDECYVRVYHGATGQVVFSAPAGNGTGMEFPVIVDVDGDFATEIVVPRADNTSGCPSPDPLFSASGSFSTSSGFVVYRDPQDRWANSRPVWNQHAYSITHVNDDAVVPNSSSVQANWQVPGYNNFRQNAQGDIGVLELADLTVEIEGVDICMSVGNVMLEARVCNRGTAPVRDGIDVEFRQTIPPDTGLASSVLVCVDATNVLLQPGDCTLVSCNGSITPGAETWVVADPNDTIADCHPANNDGAGSLAICPA